MSGKFAALQSGDNDESQNSNKPNPKFYALVRYKYDHLEYHDDNYAYAEMNYDKLRKNRLHRNPSHRYQSSSIGIFPLDETTKEDAIEAIKKYVLESFEIENGDKHHLPNIGSQKFESVTIIPSDALIQIDFQFIYDYAKADIDQEIARIDEEKQKKRDLAEYERLKKLFEKDGNK